MSEIAASHDVAADARLPTATRPTLEVLPGGGAATATAEPAARDMPSVARSVILGYILGFLVAAVGITIAGTIGGLGFGASLALGAFVGSWGGGGFGFMIGGTLPLAHYLDSGPHAAHQPQGETHGTPAR